MQFDFRIGARTEESSLRVAMSGAVQGRDIGLAEQEASIHGQGTWQQPSLK